MKTYFVKYLPVEGEIKIGDLIWDGRINPQPPDWPYYFIEEDDDIPVNELEHKKVKLFLCSRDIQVGDNIIADYTIKGEEISGIFDVHKEGEILKEIAGDHWEIKCIDHIFNSGFSVQYALKTGCFKVIGEISPEAIWVKEGDEFERNDFNPLAQAGIEHNKPTGIIKLKCPTCKTFH